jgi:MFS transporter, DHA2 family, multidrug resistance protein
MSAAPKEFATSVRVPPTHNPWAIAFTVTLATFMEVLDTSIANVALPHIAGGLSASVDESTWVLTSYLVANAMVLPLSAWASSMFGRKNFYMFCVAMFTISSFMCGMAPTLGTLILFRILQGAGGGGLQPSEQAILADTFPPEKFGMAFAVYGMAVVCAPIIGPTLGGFIVDHVTWRWIFLINVPVGIISLLLSYRMVEDPPYLVEQKKRTRARMSIDFTGLGLVVLGLGCLQVVLDKGQEDDWLSSHFIVILSVIAAVALVAFVVWEWRQEHPILDVRLFSQRSFAISALMMFAMGFGLYGSTVLLPLYTQQILGYSAQDAGMVISPGGIATMFVMPLMGFMMMKVQVRGLIAAGFVLSALSLMHMSGINPQTDFGTAVMYRVYQSVSLGFLFVPITTMAYLGIPQEKNNQVSSIVNLGRNVGGSFGIAMITTMLARRSQAHQHQLIGHLSGYDRVFQDSLHNMTSMFVQRGFSHADATQQAYGRIYGMVQMQSAAMSYVDAIWLMGVVSLFMIPLVFLLKKNKPGEAKMGAH